MKDRPLQTNLLLATGYAGLAWIISHFFSLVAPLWPSTALAVVAVLLGGARWLPGIALGSWVANDLIIGWSTAGALWVTLGNVLAPWLAGTLFRLQVRDPLCAFCRIRSTTLFFLTFGVLNGGIAGLFGAWGATYFEQGPASMFLSTWLRWSVGDAASALLLAPALLFWWKDPPWRHPPEAPLELALATIALLAGTGWLYSLPPASALQSLVLGFWPLALLPLAWAAMRFAPRDAYTLLALAFGVMAAGTLFGRGPFADADPYTAFTALQLQISLLGALVLLVSSLDQERRTAHRSLRELAERLRHQVDERTRKLTESHDRLERIVEALPAPMIMNRAEDGRIEQANEAAARLLDTTREALIGASTVDFYCDPEERPRLLALLDREGVARQAELCVRTAIGRRRWVLVTAALIPDDGDYVLAVLQDISRQRRDTRQLRRLVMIDELTGTLTRRALLERAEELLAAGDGEVALMIVDLDHFKEVNDRHGHLAGDEVLRRVAAALKSVLREQDLIGRLGGEEFVVVARTQHPGAARELAERLRTTIAGLDIEVDEDTRCRPSISIGVVETEADALPLRELLRRADHALYQAKARGRNRVAFWQPDTPPKPPRPEEAADRAAGE